jgi:hypothetical protein
MGIPMRNQRSCLWKCFPVVVLVFLGWRAPAPLLAQARLGLPQDDMRLTPRNPPDQLFRVESEAQLKERITKECLALGQKKVLFPPEANVPFSDNPQVFPEASTGIEAANLCSYPLYFEDPRTERYGLYCPLAQPLISTSRFYLDTLLLPVKMIVNPPWSLRCLENGPSPQRNESQ